jgi:hypothetical protein
MSRAQNWVGRALLVAVVAGTTAAGTAAQAIEVELKAPMLVCRELAGGVRPPGNGSAEPEHDLVFFVLSGRKADGSEIRQVAPSGGAHLKIDNSRRGMIVKDISLWKGTLSDGESVTFILSVREQDGQDSAESDLNEASEVASKVDNNKRLAELARIPVHEILQGRHGENDHIGTIVVRIKNVNGHAALECEPGADAHYLKGHASNHSSRRAFRLSGDHSDYELHLRLED